MVLLVIDQWPEWSFETKRPYLHEGGFDRLLTEGSWHVGRHPSAVTLTAPGHALLGTGDPTAVTGIVANEWYHRDSDRVLQSVEAEDGSVSPKWLRVAALGDAVELAHTGARAVSVSLKDRAAVLPLGHHGIAVWYQSKTVDWVSNRSTQWLAAHNRFHPVALHLHDVWEPLDPQRLRTLSGRRDFERGEVGEKGFEATFPHAIDATKRPSEALLATPLGNQLVLETALAAIDGERLGEDRVPDLLVVSLSAHDYIAHGWGHESWETWDGELRLDRELDRFLDALDRRVGEGQWAMLVTSDHGGSRLPELARGSRLRYSQIRTYANAAAERILGHGTWVTFAEQPSIFLSREVPMEKRELVLDAIVTDVRDMPGIERVEKSSALAGNCERRPVADQAICWAIDRERTGDVVYQALPGWVFEDDDEPMATSHGSSHDYDQLVPLIELPPDRSIHRPQTAPDGELPETTVPAILSSWLGVSPPSSIASPAPESDWAN